MDNLTTKKIKVEFEEVKVVTITLDLGNDIERYQSRYLALKNHQRETKEILDVRNFYGSNQVEVTYLIEDDDEAAEIEKVKEHAGQFGKITYDPEVETAYILDKDANGIWSALDWKEFYVF